MLIGEASPGAPLDNAGKKTAQLQEKEEEQHVFKRL